MLITLALSSLYLVRRTKLACDMFLLSNFFVTIKNSHCNSSCKFQALLLTEQWWVVLELVQGLELAMLRVQPEVV